MIRDDDGTYATSVWLCDDSATVRIHLITLLHDAGMRVRAFENPLDLLRALQTEQPNALVLDAAMPELDIFGLLARELPKIPIVVVSALRSNVGAAVAIARYAGYRAEGLHKGETALLPEILQRLLEKE